MARAAHTAETPSETDLNNGAAITLGVRFTVDDATPIDTIWFYAPATNSGTYTAELWRSDTDDDPNGSGTGTSLGSGSLSSASVTPGAWNGIPLSAPVVPDPDLVYTASVHTSSGRFVRTANAFQSASISGGGVTLLQAGSDPNPPGLGSLVNGVFVEGATSAYPNSQFNFADYFIDVGLLVDDGEVDVTAAAPLGALVGAASVGRTVIGTAAAPLGAVVGAATVGVSKTVTGSASLGGLTGAASVINTPGAGRRSGGWQSLLDIVRDARDTRDREVAAPPSACWRCGEPLSVGSTGELRCRFDGWSPR